MKEELKQTLLNEFKLRQEMFGLNNHGNKKK